MSPEKYDDFELFKHEFDGLLFGQGGVAFAACVGVEGKGFFEVGSDAEIVYDQATGFVFVVIAIVTILRCQ